VVLQPVVVEEPDPARSADRDRLDRWWGRRLVLAAMTMPASTPGPDDGTSRRGIVFFHAHPDDEAIFTGGTIAMLGAAGCPVTLVVATSGELGQRRHGPCDEVGRLREEETRRACSLLGVERVEFLRYRDSGMPGDPANGHPDAFHRADPDEAAGRLAGIIAQQHASDLVIYDAGGIYGHPDHVQVHRVGARAARLAALPTVYESTVDRDYLDATVGRHLVSQAHQDIPADLTLGVPSGLVTTTVDTVDHLEVKRAAITAHRSQIRTASEVVTMASTAFAQLYGLEWYIRRGPAGALEHLVPDRIRAHLTSAA
jgi:LmbE family N-acetylglucosaminyl deacetylase